MPEPVRDLACGRRCAYPARRLVIAIGRIFLMLGMDYDALAALALPLSVLPFACLLWMVWRHRARITDTVAAALQLDSTTTPFLRA